MGMSLVSLFSLWGIGHTLIESPITRRVILVVVLNLYTQNLPVELLLKITPNISRHYLEERKVF